MSRTLLPYATLETIEIAYLTKDERTMPVLGRNFQKLTDEDADHTLPNLSHPTSR